MILEEIQALFSKYPVTKDCRVKLLGVRGYYPLEGENELGIYDDSIFQIIDDGFKGFEASTDPGWKFLRDPVNSKGCAQLTEGLWWYEFGLHKGHPALTQATEVVVRRLDNKGKFLCLDKGDFSINIHSGGSSYEVDAWSAGCQVIKSDPPWGGQWQRFYEPIATKCKEYGQTTVPYLLVNSLVAIPERWSVLDPATSEGVSNG